MANPITLSVCFFVSLTACVFANNHQVQAVYSDSHSKPACAPPSTKLLSALNATIRAELNSIWANYTHGTDCSLQQQQTQEIFDANEHSGPKSAAYGGWGGPSFLTGASDQVHIDFEKIVTNQSLSESDKTKAVDAFMSQQSSGLQTAYNKWKSDHEAENADFDAQKAQMESEIAAKASDLSAAAKSAYDSLQNIKNNTTMTEDDKWLAMKRLKATFSDDVEDELDNLFSGHETNGSKSTSNNHSTPYPHPSNKKPLQNSTHSTHSK